MLSNGNSKLKKDSIVSFSLPAIKTCPMAGECSKFCYTRGGTFSYRNVKSSYEKNLTESKSDSFVSKIVDELRKKKETLVRIHASGDFYSQEYLEKWFSIAKKIPNKKFYAYTKSLHLDFSKKPRNFSIIQSFGGKLDAKINKRGKVAKVFFTESEAVKEGYTIGSNSDLIALSRKKKIGLVAHGIYKKRVK